MVRTGLLTQLEIRPDSADEAEARWTRLATDPRLEHTPTAWFAFRFARGEYGTLAVFPDDEQRRAFIAEESSDEHRPVDVLLTRPVAETKLDVYADKLPDESSPLTKGVLLTFDGRQDRDEETRRFLIDLEPIARDEPDTSVWMAIGLEGGQYGIFDLFPDAAARRHHLLGHVPRALAKEAFSLLGSMPEMHLVDVVAAMPTPRLSHAR